MTEDDADAIKAELLVRLAHAYDIPVEILLMSDHEFHYWLHHTDEGRELLEEDRG